MARRDLTRACRRLPAERLSEKLRRRSRGSRCSTNCNSARLKWRL